MLLWAIVLNCKFWGVNTGHDFDQSYEMKRLHVCQLLFLQINHGYEPVISYWQSVWSRWNVTEIEISLKFYRLVQKLWRLKVRLARVSTLVPRQIGEFLVPRFQIFPHFWYFTKPSLTNFKVRIFVQQSLNREPSFKSETWAVMSASVH